MSHPSSRSRTYVLRNDVVSTIVDFAKGNVEDGVVNSRPSHGAGRSPVCSPYPLRGCNWTPTR